MSRRFNVGDDTPTHHFTASSSDTDSDTDLPYPTPLPRSAFLAADFTPQAYLSTLSNRHQTLEDLRSDLRARSQLLSKELLDLVNANYQDFLGLGRSLKGGDERVEEVRVGLLGFRKDVQGVREIVATREAEVKGLLSQKEDIAREVAMRRRCLEFETRLTDLEGVLVVEAVGKDALPNGKGEKEDESEEESDEEDEYDEDDDDDDDGVSGVPISKLRNHVRQYRIVLELQRSLEHQPFITAQAPRITKVRNTLLLDLSAALQRARAQGSSGQARVLKMMNLYADMGEAAEAVKVLRSLKH